MCHNVPQLNSYLSQRNFSMSVKLYRVRRKSLKPLHDTKNLQHDTMSHGNIYISKNVLHDTIKLLHVTMGPVTVSFTCPWRFLKQLSKWKPLKKHKGLSMCLLERLTSWGIGTVEWCRLRDTQVYAI